MKVVPIIAFQEELRRQVALYNSLGCSVYRDVNGSHYLVTESIEKLPLSSTNLVFEIANIPVHWIRVAG